jgi:hypothetical protein
MPLTKTDDRHGGFTTDDAHGCLLLFGYAFLLLPYMYTTVSTPLYIVLCVYSYELGWVHVRTLVTSTDVCGEVIGFAIALDFGWFRNRRRCAGYTPHAMHVVESKQVFDQ